MAETTVDATGYLVIKGSRSYYRVNGVRQIEGAKVTVARQSRPPKLGADEVAIRVTIRLPKQAFEPLQPEALIVVPEELIQHAVEVEATDEA